MTATRLSTKTITAIVIGNALEWYDFVVYSYMTVYIAKLFFPTVSHTNSLLAATAAFGVAFCMRPLGGLVFGLYADKVGRKAAITLIIAMMFVATLIIVVAPTYAHIGIAAPLLIVLARLLQGFSAGGEFGASTALLIELSPPNNRGYYGAWQMVGQNLSSFFGALVGILLINLLSTEQIESWGWRIPFIFGLIIAPVGVYIRRHLDETQLNAHLTSKTDSLAQIGKSLKEYKGKLLLAMGLVVGGTVATYTKLHMPTYVSKHLHLSMSASFAGLIIGVAALVTLMPLFGALSDRIGRKPILVTSILIYLLVIYPLFYWLAYSPTLMTVIVVEFIFCVLLAGYFGVFAVVLAELFPREIRSTSLAISYNFTVMLFGGFAQFIVTWLISVTGNTLAIAYYLMFAMAISLIAALCYQEKGRENEYD